jgi:nucleoside-diphosphate-sugar epimerase
MTHREGGLAIENDAAARQIYNVAEPDALQECHLVELIGKLAGWNGTIEFVSDAQLPQHLQQPCNVKQDWQVDTTKIRDQLGYAEIVGRDEGIRRTIERERANPPEHEPHTYDYQAEEKVQSAERLS